MFDASLKIYVEGYRAFSKPVSSAARAFRYLVGKVQTLLGEKKSD